MPLTRQEAIIVGLILICLSSSQYAGISFQLTRLTNDIFKNPTAKRCVLQAKNQKFCEDTNSRCNRSCCWCTCDDQASTFDRRVMKCRKDDKIRLGKFLLVYSPIEQKNSSCITSPCLFF